MVRGRKNNKKAKLKLNQCDHEDTGSEETEAGFSVDDKLPAGQLCTPGTEAQI